MWSLFGRKSKKEQRDELLSAYLDGELNEGERERLEARLSEDPSLRAELRAMHSTVSLIRELPQVVAPRNFILSESTVERWSPAPEAHYAYPEPRTLANAWAAPLLTAATTVVSLLFVAVLAGDLLLSGVGGAASVPAPIQEPVEAPRMALEAAPTGEGPAGEAELEADAAPGRASPSPTSDETMRGELPEEPEVAAEKEEAAAEATREAQAPAGTGGTSPPTGGDGPTEEAAALVAPTVTSVTALTPTIPPEDPVISEDELGLVEPTPSELEVTPQPIQEEGRTDRLVPPLPWNLLEIALGLASLVLTVVTIQAWRLRRR